MIFEIIRVSFLVLFIFFQCLLALGGAGLTGFLADSEKDFLSYVLFLGFLISCGFAIFLAVMEMAR